MSQNNTIEIKSNPNEKTDEELSAKRPLTGSVLLACLTATAHITFPIITQSPGAMWMANITKWLLTLYTIAAIIYTLIVYTATFANNE